MLTAHNLSVKSNKQGDYHNVSHTCDSTAGSRKIPFIKPVCRSTVPVDQTTVFENFRKYYENPIKSVPLFQHGPV